MSEQEQIKFRIRVDNKTYWKIERYQFPGFVSRGKYKDDPIKEKWLDEPVGYYSTLKHAARGLLDNEISGVWPAGGMTDLSGVPDMIEAAEVRVAAAVAVALDEREELRQKEIQKELDKAKK